MAAATLPPRPRGHYRTEVRANPNIQDPNAEGIAGTKTTVRYIGQGRRGLPPAPVLDDVDLRLAIAELEAAREMLWAANELPAGGIGERRDRHEARAVAIAKVQLARRILDDLCARRPLPAAIRDGR